MTFEGSLGGGPGFFVPARGKNGAYHQLFYLEIFIFSFVKVFFQDLSGFSTLVLMLSTVDDNQLFGCDFLGFLKPLLNTI